MSQEAKTKSPTLRCSFDDARNVGHDEALSVAIRHDAERRLHRGEGIACYLRSGAGQGTQQGALTSIRETNESDIGKQLELEDDGTLHHGFARLRIAWRLIGSGGKVLVSHAATSALEKHHDLSVVGHVADVFARLGIINDCAARDIDVTVLTICTCASAGTSVASVTGKDMSFEAKVQEGPIVMIASEIDVSTTPAVAAVWSSHWDILGAMHVHGAATALT